MKTKICLLVLLFFYLNLSAQWQQEWNSPSISSLLYSGWIAFSEDGEDWDYKYYLIDEASMKIMNSYYSSTVLYQYNFTDAEIFGGYQIYSLGVDSISQTDKFCSKKITLHFITLILLFGMLTVKEFWNALSPYGIIPILLITIMRYIIPGYRLLFYLMEK
jgi:hypothetical protein